jgi:diacylglycerol kinase
MFDDPRTTLEILKDQARDAAGLASLIGLIWAIAAWAIALSPAHLPV